MAGLLAAGGIAKYKSATVTKSGNSTNNFSASINVISGFGIPEKVAKKLTAANFFGQITNYDIRREHDYPGSMISCDIVSYTPSTGILSVRCAGNYSEIDITRYMVHAVWVE